MRGMTAKLLLGICVTSSIALAQAVPPAVVATVLDGAGLRATDLAAAGVTESEATAIYAAAMSAIDDSAVAVVGAHHRLRHTTENTARVRADVQRGEGSGALAAAVAEELAATVAYDLVLQDVRAAALSVARSEVNTALSILETNAGAPVAIQYRILPWSDQKLRQLASALRQRARAGGSVSGLTPEHVAILSAAESNLDVIRAGNDHDRYRAGVERAHRAMITTLLTR